MTEQETAKLVALVCLAYPMVETTPERVALWHEFLKDADSYDAMQQLKKHIETEKFPPTISDIAIVIEKRRKLEREEHDEYLRLHGSAEPMKQLGVGD